MDVSQLCSDPLEPTSSLTNLEEISNKQPPAKVNKIDFLLTSYQELDSATASTTPTTTTTTTTTNTTEVPNSISKVLLQCSQLCEDICQLKLYNKSLSDQERNNMIDHLSETAQAALRAIQSAEYCIADSQKNMNMSLSQDEEEDEEDIEEEDEEDEENFRVNQTSMIHNHAEYQLIRQARNIQSNSRTRPRYRRRNRRSMIGQKCHSCNTTETPEWRRGPDGARTLCNACGLHYSKLLKKGSIGVQTQNYLITGGMPKVSSSAKQIAANTIKNYRAPEGSTINYPFVLMDPKRNAANEKLNHGTPYRASSPSQRLVSVNPEEFVHTDLPHDNGHPRKPNSSSNANVGPLRIHQWRHQ